MEKRIKITVHILIEVIECSLFTFGMERGLVLILANACNWKREKNLRANHGSVEALMHLFFNPKLLFFFTLFRIPWISKLGNRIFY